MRKNIVMPKFLIEAVNDMQEALNLYSQSNPISKKKFKGYSFSRVVCHLISQGIDREFKMTQNANKELWSIKENFDKFKQLIETAYLLSQEFNIDKPHRKKRTQISIINKDQNIDIDIEDTDIDQDIDIDTDIDQDLDIDQSIDLDKDLGLDQDQDFNPDQDFDQDFD